MTARAAPNRHGARACGGWPTEWPSWPAPWRSAAHKEDPPQCGSICRAAPIVLAEDAALMRAGLVSLLEGLGHILVAAVGDGD